MRRLHIDIETYSSVDLKTSGVYKYAESDDFEILILCYAFDDEEIVSVNMAMGQMLPGDFLQALVDPSIIKYAHNAMFERICMRAVGMNVPIDQWECTAVKSAYCGLPFGLEAVSEALKLGDKSKSLAGKNLIKFFSVPQKVRGSDKTTRNYAENHPDKFQEYIAYCVQDVEAEREIDRVLDTYEVCKFERNNYFLDQEINDRGIEVDLTFVQAAYDVDVEFKEKAIQRMKDITQLSNPNSPKQLVEWLNQAQKNVEVKSVAKENLQKLTEIATGAVADILSLRRATSKTSTKKYTAMLASVGKDNRIRGLFQFYGANKTGRWAGRIVQLQNLPVNRMKDLDTARNIIRMNDIEIAEMVYGMTIPNVLSELVRAAFVSKPGHSFAVSDFAAIEARVLSWVAAEEWRMDVFATHGKIYEAAAAKMFNVDITLVTKDSEYRMRAKNGELALGYQGALGAMVRMAGQNTTLTKSDMLDIISKWRKANPKIVRLWNEINECAIEAVANKSKVETGYRGISYESDGKIMKLNLPSGRYVSYFEPRLITNRFNSTAIAYKNIDQETKKWCETETYGGKLVENIVQALSRDVLVYAMQNLRKANFLMNMHVHDEIIAEVEENIAEDKLKEMEDIMKQEIPWAPDLILGAEGYVTNYYKKD